MPRMDGTEPASTGKMTGRGHGPCAGNERGLHGNRGAGAQHGVRHQRRGMNCGCGMGMGRGAGLGCADGRFLAEAEADNATAKERLTARRDALRERLEAVEKQLENT